MKAILVAVTLMLAACSLGPTATPFAPKDLGMALPREVNGRSLTVRTLTADQLAQAGAISGDDVLAQVLAARGKQPSDVLAAAALGIDLSEPTRSLVITAIRVPGVLADDLRADMLARQPAGTAQSAENVGGKSVTRVAPAGRDVSFVLYSRGEVLYTVGAGTTADEPAVLEALP